MYEKNNLYKWLFASDVDDTLLGDDNALFKLGRALKSIRQNIVLVFNSSRPCASLKNSLRVNPNLPKPDFLIGALGTEIEAPEPGNEICEYSQQLSKNWDRGQISQLMSDLGFIAHDDEYQTPFKASYNVPGYEQYQLVVEQLKKAGITAKVIFSSNENLDIIPKGIDKGFAVDHLRNKLSLEKDQVIVAGDSGNDLDMFHYGFKGIIVGNADLQLKALTGSNIYHARNIYANGVLEGLQHWGVVSN